MTRVTPTALPDVLLFELDVAQDERGSLIETWRDDHVHPLMPDVAFVQDNVSTSRAGVIRGLHYQQPGAQAKLISVLHGVVFDVAVDIRRGSPHFGKWVAETLRGMDGRQLYIPAGFAHGFAVLEGPAVVQYKCSAHFDAEAARTIRWDDPTIGIEWPITPRILSERDRIAPALAAVLETHLPEF